jgi:protein-disulfide isomerase
VDSAELMQAGPLGEMTMGDPSAPVTVIEYASMTCTHCAHFAKETFPEFKEKYIDTGKVYFIFREFPLDPVATAAFMLARCVPESQYFTFVEAMFKNQDLWAFTDDRIGGLTKMAKQAGLTQEKFDECLKNQELLDGVNWVRQRGAETFEVSSTPTFFINGEEVRGALPFDEFEKLITAHLPS